MTIGAKFSAHINAMTCNYGFRACLRNQAFNYMLSVNGVITTDNAIVSYLHFDESTVTPVFNMCYKLVYSYSYIVI